MISLPLKFVFLTILVIIKLLGIKDYDLRSIKYIDWINWKGDSHLWKEFKEKNKGRIGEKINFLRIFKGVWTWMVRPLVISNVHLHHLYIFKDVLRHQIKMFEERITTIVHLHPCLQYAPVLNFRWWFYLDCKIFSTWA